MKIQGRLMPVDRPNVDTDQIIPAVHLTTISKKGLGKFLFEQLPDNPLKSGMYDQAKLLLSRENFGCGSSREHAAWAITDRGFQAVVASSFARIFEENCYNNGLVPIALSTAEIDRLFAAARDQKTLEAAVDVEAEELKVGNETFRFKLDPLKKQFILRGGFLKYMEALIPKIREWEKGRPEVF